MATLNQKLSIYENALSRKAEWGNKQYIEMVYDIVKTITDRLNLKENSKFVRYYLNGRLLLKDIKKNGGSKKWANVQLKNIQRTVASLNDPAQMNELKSYIAKSSTLKKNNISKEQPTQKKKGLDLPWEDNTELWRRVDEIKEYLTECYHNGDWGEIYDIVEELYNNNFFEHITEELSNILPYSEIEDEHPGFLASIITSVAMEEDIDYRVVNNLLYQQFILDKQAGKIDKVKEFIEEQLEAIEMKSSSYEITKETPLFASSEDTKYWYGDDELSKLFMIVKILIIKEKYSRNIEDEKRIKTNPEYWNEYKSLMKKYYRDDYMEIIKDEDPEEYKRLKDQKESSKELKPIPEIEHSGLDYVLEEAKKSEKNGKFWIFDFNMKRINSKIIKTKMAIKRELQIDSSSSSELDIVYNFVLRGSNLMNEVMKVRKSMGKSGGVVAPDKCWPQLFDVKKIVHSVKDVHKSILPWTIDTLSRFLNDISFSISYLDMEDDPSVPDEWKRDDDPVSFTWGEDKVLRSRKFFDQWKKIKRDILDEMDVLVRKMRKQIKRQPIKHKYVRISNDRRETDAYTWNHLYVDADVDPSIINGLVKTNKGKIPEVEFVWKDRFDIPELLPLNTDWLISDKLRQILESFGDSGSEYIKIKVHFIHSGKQKFMWIIRPPRIPVNQLNWYGDFYKRSEHGGIEEAPDKDDWEEYKIFDTDMEYNYNLDPRYIPQQYLIMAMKGGNERISEGGVARGPLMLREDIATAWWKYIKDVGENKEYTSYSKNTKKWTFE